MATVHVVVDPVHAPDQPRKNPVWSGTAVSVTDVPVVNPALQAPPQLIPVGLLFTVPEPDNETVSEYLLEKVAEMV
jgi:hypothetical protein